MTKPTGILGIGNLLLSDEGFGIHTIHYLEQHYTFPETIRINDAGTAGIYMAPFLEECDPILVIDVIDMDADPGSVLHFNSKDIGAGTIPRKMSPHQLGLLEMLEICKFRDCQPETVEFFCVVPADLHTSMELSPQVGPRVKEIAERIVDQLRQAGHTIIAKIQATAKVSHHA
ncbi:MAG: HyaD/HybD family hydrogenase maturation endopeptidase [Pseudomonadota bacterium]